jgi:O-antigen/teichoic acid export membrane protein
MNPSILSSIAWSLCRTWGGRLAGFVIYFQLVRVLTPTEMGLFSAAFAVFVFLEVFVDQGMMQAVVQRATVTPAQLNAVLLLNMLAAGLLAAGLWLAAADVEALLGIPGLAAVLQVGCLTLLFSSAGFAQEAMARRAFQFRRLALRTLISTVAGGAVGVYMAATGHGVWALVTQMLLSAALNTAILWHRPAWNPAVRPDFHGAGGLARFGAQVTGMRLIEFGGTRGVELLVAGLLGAGALGMYAVGTKIHYISVQLLGLALTDVAHSGFARLAGDAARLRAAYLSAIGAVALIATPVWVILCAAAPEIAVIAFGPRWAECAQVLAPFAALGALQVVQKFDTAAMNAMGCPGLSLLVSAVRAPLALSAVWAFHGQGLQAVALAFVVSQLLVTPLNLWLLRRTLAVRWSDWLLRLWRPLLAGCVAGAAMHFCRSIDAIHTRLPLARFLVLGALGAAAYLLVVALVARGQLHGLVLGLRALRSP